MKKITREMFDLAGPARSVYYTNDVWRRTASELVGLKAGECVLITPDGFGYEEGTPEYEEFPAVADAAKVRSLLYSRGMGASIKRNREGKELMLCVTKK